MNLDHKDHFEIIGHEMPKRFAAAVCTAAVSYWHRPDAAVREKRLAAACPDRVPEVQ